MVTSLKPTTVGGVALRADSKHAPKPTTKAPVTDDHVTSTFGAGNKFAGGTSITKSGKVIPATIVTSSTSRSNYTENAGKLQDTTASLRLNSANDPSVVNFLKNNNMPTDYNSRAALAKQYGIQGYTGSSSQNQQLLGFLQGGQSNTGAAVDTKGDTTTAAPTVKQNDDGSTTTTNADGTTKTTNPDGTGNTTTPDGTTTPTLPPEIQQQYDDALAGLDQSISDAKTVLDQARSSLNNDPAANNAIDMIMTKYDQQIEAMKAKNALLAGSYNKNGARTGMMQYANEMYTDFMSQEQDKASQRVSNLLLLEAQEVLKAQQAYKEGNVKAFEAASKSYQSAQKDKINALNDLLTQTDKMVKQSQAEAKAAKDTSKQQITDDIRLSTALGKTVADTIANSGITDPKKVRAYVEAMAEEAGISNPDILQSSIIKAQQDADKTAVQIANTKSTIANRTASGTGTGGKITVQSASAKLKGGLKPISQGGVLGDDKFMDPQIWINQRDQWISDKLPIETFNNLYKRYLNPESYKLAGFAK